MPQATFDPARLLDLFARVARDGSIVINFTDSDSLSFDISIYEFQFFVKDYDQSSIKRIDLSESNGITNTGTSLEIELTEEITTLRDRVYYYELINLTINKTWLCGNFTLHNGKFDGVNSNNSVIIAENGESITIQINEVGEISNSVYQVTTTATLTPNISLYNSFEITAQDGALTIANPTGTIGNFDGFVIRVTDDGTGRAITYGNGYRAFGSALPTTTTAGKTLYLICIYNATDDVYDTASREEV